LYVKKGPVSTFKKGPVSILGKNLTTTRAKQLGLKDLKLAKTL
jgi:hypothetical protein